jgi:hypothetical protein
MEDIPHTPSADNADNNTPPYTEFFSWGSDAYGQLALANADDDND